VLVLRKFGYVAYMCCIYVLQCVVACCTVLQCVALHVRIGFKERCSSLSVLALRRCVCVACMCCSVLQCVAVCCSVLQCVAVCCIMLQYVCGSRRIWGG